MHLIPKIKTVTFFLAILGIGYTEAAYSSLELRNKIPQTELKAFPKEVISSKVRMIEEAIPNYHRPTISTYLTYPEWYIVYSSQEYANYLKSNSPSGFPYFSSISQYWSGYRTVNRITKNRFSHNIGDHVMLYVIGTSYSLEYTIKGLYEKSVGKLTEFLSGQEPTEEDIYAQKIADQYANYITEEPWFDFSYAKALKGLWTKTSIVGPHIIRKTERKLAFSLEYSIKGMYAAVIRFGSHLAYGKAPSRVYALADNIPRSFFINNKDIKLVKSINPKMAVISLPFEQPFTNSLKKIMKDNIQFKDIAGNNEILITAVTPKKWTFKNKQGEVLFTVDILTQPRRQRIGIRAPTTSLLAILAYLDKNKISIEHVYPY